ncbi:hypothetical protein R1flu_016737 [Riccia fluitans]|uniref:Ubiquitin-like protease family profile domain-containing protein n=1 Tax=Riccia fluitans TaxID=41844 RepID=A0ABD1YMQ5_9MARC
MWRADNVIVGVNFVRGHRTLQDEVDRMCIDVCYQSLLDALKAVVGTLSNSLAIFEYMRSIFDSYVNPSNDPNVQPLVKGLDADDFSVDKFFGLQDPTSSDDVQASPDFEEDLRINERLRLQAKSQIVPIPTLVDLTQYTSSPENEGSEDQGCPCKNNLTKTVLESAMYKGRYVRGDVINMYINEAFLKKLCEQLHNMFYVNTFSFTKASELVMGIMNVEQQQDGHSCGKHVLQMLAGAAKKESKGLDRCFREEGLRYIATLDQVRSFDLVFGMYLSGKLAGPPM